MTDKYRYEVMAGGDYRFVSLDFDDNVFVSPEDLPAFARCVNEALREDKPMQNDSDIRKQFEKEFPADKNDADMLDVLWVGYRAGYSARAKLPLPREAIEAGIHAIKNEISLCELMRDSLKTQDEIEDANNIIKVHEAHITELRSLLGDGDKQ